MIKILIIPLLVFLFLTSIVFADGLLVRVDAGSQGADVNLFDYLQSGWTVWLLKATGSSPALYGGRSFSRGKISAEFVPGLVFDREKGVEGQRFGL